MNLKHSHKKVVNSAGVTLERRYTYLPPETWLTIEALALDSNTSISLIINNAINGSQIKEKNDSNNS